MIFHVCSCCRRPLSDEEIFYYESRCENCESDWHDRIESWRHGGNHIGRMGWADDKEETS